MNCISTFNCFLSIRIEKSLQEEFNEGLSNYGTIGGPKSKGQSPRRSPRVRSLEKLKNDYGNVSSDSDTDERTLLNDPLVHTVSTCLLLIRSALFIYFVLFFIRLAEIYSNFLTFFFNNFFRKLHIKTCWKICLIIEDQGTVHTFTKQLINQAII